MDIENLSGRSCNQRNNHSNLPRSIRSIIVGKSGSGKTTVMMNLLLRDGFLDYNHLQIYGRSLHQEEYQLLKKLEKYPKEVVYQAAKNQATYDMAEVFKKLEHMKLKLKPDIKIEFFEDDSDIIDPNDVNKKDKNLIIFDDIIGEKQKKVENYYTRGRHSNIDCFYLSQNFFKIPRQTIRENSNLIILFYQDRKSLNHIYQDFVYDDFSFDEFKKLCNKVWSEDFGFLTIDMTKKKTTGRYKNKFTSLFT